MRLIFCKTPTKESHLAEDMRVYNGNVIDVSLKRGRQLLKSYPRNFRPFGSPLLKKPNPPLAKPLGKPLAKLTSTPLVSILIPQRGRPNKIKRCLELILKNTSYPNYEVILICDRDDLASVKEIPKHPRIKIVVDPSPKRRMFVGKINYGFRASKGKFLVYLSNDVEVTKNWLTEAMKSMLGVFPPGGGLISLSHGSKRDKHAYHGLISKEFVNKFLKGNIFYPGYIHFWCDLELNEQARRYGRFYFCPTSTVYHKPVEDRLHAEGMVASFHQGANLLIKRRKEKFPL